MADRFPKIEDLDLSEPPSQDPAGEGSFLDRERAALGDDANQFATEQDQGTTSTAAFPEEGGDLLGANDDFGGDGEPAGAAPTTQDDLDFEKSFPAIDTQNEAVAPGGKITGPTSSEPSGYTGYTAPTFEEDSEPIRKWREKRDADLSRRDSASTAKKDETVAKARRDVDDFYETYNRKTDKGKAETARQAAEFLQNREDTTSGGTSWERIAKMVDLSGKGVGGGGEGSDKKKMREILLDLKADQRAPGVAGV